MAFPAMPNYDIGESDGLFLIQEPFGLRNSIFPIWDCDPDNDRTFGLGTAFRIDPFGNVLTAFHVLEDYFEYDQVQVDNVIIKAGANPLGLDNFGLVYGAVGLDPQNWMKVQGLKTYVGVPHDLFTRDRKPKNLTEVACLKMPSNKIDEDQHHFLPVAFSATVNVGDQVMAVGFPKMKPDQHTNEQELLVISAHMYGSIRTVIDIHPLDGELSEPWPKIFVDGDWPAGMSGGPVFNEQGNVVGIVSKGSEHTKHASARLFSGDNISEFLCPHLDPWNPSRYFGWGIIVEDVLVGFFLLEEEAHNEASVILNSKVRPVSKDIDGNGYMIL